MAALPGGRPRTIWTAAASRKSAAVPAGEGRDHRRAQDRVGGVDGLA
jgi:hypothetical protein